MQSVINRSLKDRQALLKDLIKDAPEEGFPISAAMTGRVVALLPGAHSPAVHQPLIGAKLTRCRTAETLSKHISRALRLSRTSQASLAMVWLCSKCMVSSMQRVYSGMCRQADDVGRAGLQAVEQPGGHPGEV